MSRVIAIVCCAIVIILSGCGSDDPSDDPYVFTPFEPVSPQTKGSRHLGVAISDSTEGFMSSYTVAQQSGFSSVELNIPWDAIETAEGVYQDPNGLLSATTFYGTEGVEVSFSIAVINTVTRTAPAYLDAYDYDAPEFLTAFTNMMDWFMANIPVSVTVPSIAIGNEVDLFLDGAAWTAYTTFYQGAASHMQTNHPTVPIGVKTTIMNGVLGGELTELQTINAYSDIIMLNYYPMGAGFQVLDPSVIHTHFAQITTDFPTKDIWITEIGYQSGAAYCNSSELKQAGFYHEMFAAWDTYQARIPHVMINWLHDQSPAQIAEWEVYYGSSDPAFVEYLSTLGLRNYNNTDKYAWIQLLTETTARGF